VGWLSVGCDHQLLSVLGLITNWAVIQEIHGAVVEWTEALLLCLLTAPERFLINHQFKIKLDRLQPCDFEFKDPTLFPKSPDANEICPCLCDAGK